MSVLEIIAEKHLGARALKKHPRLRTAFKRIEKSAGLAGEKERITSIVELCFEYDQEKDPEEKKNILQTLEEISANEPLQLPTESIEDWDQRLRTTDAAYAAADKTNTAKNGVLLKKYFSLRAKAGLSTQAMVAQKSGLSRSYVAIIESGEHTPQQKTLQKLAKALGVDVAELIP